MVPGPELSPEHAEPTRLGRQLVRVALASNRHPKRVWLLLVLPTLIFGALALRVPLDLSFAGLMDREHPEMRRYFAASQRHGLGGRLPLLVEGPDDKLDPFIEELSRGLLEDGAVRSVRTRARGDQVSGSMAWFARSETFSSWRQWVESPAEREKLKYLRARLELDAKADPFVREGARLVLVNLHSDSFEQSLDAQDFPRIDTLTRSLASVHGLEANYAGMPAIVEQDQRMTLGRIGVMTPLSLLFALALLACLERRLLGLVAVALPMLGAGAITLGVMGLSFGSLTLMESLFGVLIFGLGVDFALHLGFRAQEERARGASFEEALVCSYGHTGPGVVAGALTTAGSFGLLALAPEPSFARLGASGALGIVLCLCFMLVVLPAAWTGLGGKVPGEETRSRTSGALLAFTTRVGRSACRRPKYHIGLALLVVTISAFALPSLRYESDLSKVVNRDLPALSSARAMQKIFSVDPIPWVLEAEDLGQARGLEESILALPLFGRVESAARFFPEDLEERSAWFKDNAAIFQRLLVTQPDAAELVMPLIDAASETIPTLRSLGLETRASLMAPDGDLVLYVFSARSHMDGKLAAEERVALRKLAPEATSMAILFELLLSPTRPWMPGLLGSVLVFVSALLLFDLRRVPWVLLALLPVVGGCVFAFGVLAWSGVALNTVTLMAAPLILGLGVDDGIHLVHRIRELPVGQEARAAASVSRAIALTTATTCASFATLLLSGHPGLESMAWVMILALPACLLASASTLPALVTLARGVGGS